MNNTLLKLFIVLGLSVTAFSLPTFVSADQWYDRLPKSGEYVPLPESNTNQIPRDLDSVNVPDSTGNNGQDQSVNENLQNNESNEVVAAPVGRTLMWSVAIVVGLIIILLITAPLWLKRVFRKMSP